MTSSSFCADFYPRPPRGGRPEMLAVLYAEELISTHALREEGDSRLARRQNSSENFYPRPPRGGRQCWMANTRTDKEFLPTPSARRATAATSAQTATEQAFLPTPSARRATTGWSLHAVYRRYFYPRPPRGGRLAPDNAKKIANIFLPTPSARRATFRHPIGGRRIEISTHALREEGDCIPMPPCPS